jgi:hypothetical protein
VYGWYSLPHAVRSAIEAASSRIRRIMRISDGGRSWCVEAAGAGVAGARSGRRFSGSSHDAWRTAVRRPIQRERAERRATRAPAHRTVNLLGESEAARSEFHTPRAARLRG